MTGVNSSVFGVLNAMAKIKKKNRFIIAMRKRHPERTTRMHDRRLARGGNQNKQRKFLEEVA